MIRSFVSPVRLSLQVLALVLVCAAPAAAQIAPCPEPANQPPAGSPVLVKCWELRAHPINELNIEFDTYDYYIKTERSIASQNKWQPYDEDLVKADFWSLWRTGFLENLWIEVIDEPFKNGVAGKHVIFHIEERSKLKAVDYIGANEDTKVDVQKIEDKLRDENVHVALDSMVDEATVRKVKGVIRQLYSDKGYNDVRIETNVKALPAGPKLVHMTFVIDQGPKYKIEDVLFEGNVAFSDAELRSQMKENKPRTWYSLFTSGGTYLDAKFADDADAVQLFYMNHGYVRAIVGLPKIETVKDSKDGKTRFIRLRVPVQEGRRYKVGEIKITDNTYVRTEALRSFFDLKEGDYYSYEKMQKGLQKARDIYGRLGFYQYTEDPRAVPRGYDPETGQPIGDGEPPAIVDVYVKIIEGKQYYINRISFAGNTTTHDAVARREMRVFEGGLFDSEALKESIRRLNQLGYFKPLEGAEDEIQVTPTPGIDGMVDIKLKFQEQNRNQISFGAGVSQFDGFFGQLNYQTSNFLGRGETFNVNLQRGSRARQYQIGFTEPYLFNRPLTAGFELFARQFIYPYQFTQDSVGGNFILGYPIAKNLRLFGGYGYERIKVFDINEAYLSPAALIGNPVLRDSLLIDSGGVRTVGKTTYSLVYNTINQPIFPSDGERYTAAVDIAGIGGTTEFIRMRFESIYYMPIKGRLSAGIRAEGQWVMPYGSTLTLPIFEKFFLGGEYSVRGFDMRSIGPRDPISGVVTGGNKTLLMNAELYINIAQPVRFVLFYDAGQVQDVGTSFRWYDEITRLTTPPRPLLYDPFSPIYLTPDPFVPKVEVIDRTYAFKVSTGAELRFFMPVLNVPFRLIAAYNPSRRGVFNNNLEPTKSFTFRFAVGTTF
jgi:outer membrane protein insertion porin family